MLLSGSLFVVVFFIKEKVDTAELAKKSKITINLFIYKTAICTTMSSLNIVPSN